MVRLASHLKVGTHEVLGLLTFHRHCFVIPACAGIQARKSRSRFSIRHLRPPRRAPFRRRPKPRLSNAVAPDAGPALTEYGAKPDSPACAIGGAVGVIIML